MKKILLFAFTLFLSIGLFAQDQVNTPEAEQRAERMTQMFTEKLELDEAQTKRMLEIQLQSQKHHNEISYLMDTDKEAFASRQKNLLKDVESRILLMLNEDQAKAFHLLAAKERGKKAEAERRKLSDPNTSNRNSN